jgi:hypothetical protein
MTCMVRVVHRQGTHDAFMPCRPCEARNVAENRAGASSNRAWARPKSLGSSSSFPPTHVNMTLSAVRELGSSRCWKALFARLTTHNAQYTALLQHAVHRKWAEHPPACHCFACLSRQLRPHRWALQSLSLRPRVLMRIPLGEKQFHSVWTSSGHVTVHFRALYYCTACPLRARSSLSHFTSVYPIIHA